MTVQGQPDALLESLADAVGENRLGEKILLTDSRRSGRNLLTRLTRSGRSWANLTCETPLSYAQKVVAHDLAARGVQPADSTMAFLLIAELISSTPETHQYFAPVGEHPGVLRAVHRTIAELRNHGVSSARLTPGLFLDPVKGAALIALLRSYEQALADRRWADAADALSLGTGMLKKAGAGEAVYLIPEGIFDTAKGLERQFIESLPPSRVRVLKCGPSPGLALSFGHQSGNADGLSPAQFSLFSAAGVGAETGEIFRRVLGDGVPVEDVAVLSAGDESYLHALSCTAARLGIAVTCSKGWPISRTRPGRAVVAYLRWVREGFPVRLLSDALAAGDFTPLGAEDQEKVSGTACARILRSAGIGWGRERYVPALRSEMERAVSSRHASEDDGAETSGAKAERRERIAAVAGWMGRMLELTPEADCEGLLSFPELCRAVREVARGLAAVSSPEDAEARAAIGDVMDAAGQWGAGRFCIPDAVERALSLVVSLRVGASGPRPGAMHISTPNSGWSIGRPHIFIIGLDEAAISSRSSGDPLFLDEERSAMRPPLPSSLETKADALSRLDWSLARLSGRITLSYSTRTPGSDRESFPSPLLLAAYRQAAGKEASYEDLLRHLGRPAGYFADPGGLKLSPDEAWLSRIGEGPIWANGEESALAAYTHLARGRRLIKARESDSFTEYDGRVGPASVFLDPRRNPESAVSASRLEYLAKCPLAYFYRHVLGIYPPDEPVYEPGIWLDAMSRGDVLHAVFRGFYARLGRKPCGDGSEEILIREVCREVLADWRGETPPPSEAVYLRDEAEILASALCFLAMERNAETTAVPVFFEVPFGLGPEAVEPGGPGCAEPIPIPLSGGSSLLLRGRIDRIDRAAAHEYHLWDYKTGRPFAEGGTVVGGRRLQHALYARAAEALLRGPGGDPEARVTLSGYRFPTPRGETRPIWVAEGDLAEPTDQALHGLLDLAAEGAFPAAAEDAPCKYCDYAAACPDDPSPATRRKMNAGDQTLQLLAEVNGID